jgi:hypothetical protein
MNIPARQDRAGPPLSLWRPFERLERAATGVPGPRPVLVGLIRTAPSHRVRRLATGEVADHVERFRAVYQHARHDPADEGVYEALVRHFADYSLAFMARCAHPDLPDANHQVIAQFVAHGFAGAIKAWLSDDSVTRTDLVEAAIACAPVWWI